MSIYVTPITSSPIIQLMLMVEILGVITTPMDRVLWNASEANSNCSCFCRQAVTPGKLHSGVVGWVTANAHTGKEGLDGVGVSGWGAGGFDGPAKGNQIGPPLALGPSMGGRSTQQPPWVMRDAGSFPIPGTLDLSSPWLALVYRVSWGH